MPSLDMSGPYDLKESVVSRIITARTPGNFAVGYVKENGAFITRFVGRSDSDVAAELRKQDADGSTKFKWSSAPSAKAAFDKQCRNFHEFGGYDALENEEHPEPPRGMNWKCPFCEDLG
ncbi:MAG: hypothetical protein R6X13_01200 [bacterium]|jgi:hypothetical protein